MSISPNMTPSLALRNLRIIWAALLGGQIVFLMVIAVLAAQGTAGTGAPGGGGGAASVVVILGFVAAGLLVSGVIIGLFIRNQIYKANWQGDVVTPAGYFQGNLVFLALLEGVAMVGLVAALLAGTLMTPAIIPSVIAMGIQVINFPNGRPMMSPSQTGSFTDQRP